MIKFCCNNMEESLLDYRTSIKYGPVFREYYLAGEKGSMIWYCPWCGTKLNKDLRDEFFDILEQEYKIETNIGDCFDRIDLPPEFKTDEWWKKRGL